MNVDPLPLRTCFRCEYWYAEHALTQQGDETVSAICALHRTRKYASDTCSKWSKK